MEVLSYGYLKPQNPDTGDAFFPALEQDIQQLNDHNHDGANSAPLASYEFDISSSGWAAVAGLVGIYSQTVVLPVGFNYDVCDMWFFLSSGERVYPSIARVDTQNYMLFTNDNTQNWSAHYR